MENRVQIQKEVVSVLKLDFTAHGELESLSEIGLRGFLCLSSCVHTLHQAWKKPRSLETTRSSAVFKTTGYFYHVITWSNDFPG
jgi:hypothetical protein